jgi:hypothetical protein
MSERQYLTRLPVQTALITVKSTRQAFDTSSCFLASLAKNVMLYGRLIKCQRQDNCKDPPEASTSRNLLCELRNN